MKSLACALNATNNEAVSKLVKLWENKNAQRALRGAGLSTFALSLAACGGSSTDNSTPVVTPDPEPVTPVAQTFTLTTGVDLEANFTGGDANDTFIADNTGTSEVTSTADTINGGAGIDTLNIYSDGTVGALPTLVSVETVNVYDEDTNFTLSAVDQASVTTANFIRGDGALTYTVGVNVGTVGLTNMTLTGAGADAGVTVAAAAAATSLTLNLDRISTAAADADEDINVTGAALTTVNINTSGTAVSADNVDVAGASTINIDAGVAFTTGTLATTSTTATLNISGAVSAISAHGTV